MQVQNGVRYPGPDLSEPAKDVAAFDVYTHLSEVHSLKEKVTKLTKCSLNLLNY
jgi:hypothetical protein